MVTQETLKTYYAIMTQDEYWAYHLKLHRQAINNRTAFDEFRLQKVEPQLGQVRPSFITRAQEPYEEEIMVALAMLDATGIPLLFKMPEPAFKNYLSFNPKSQGCKYYSQL